MEETHNREFDWAIPELRRSLHLLAAPCQVQIDYLQGHRVHWDELALRFSDVYILAPQLEADEYITADQAHALAALDRQLDLMSGQANARLWSDDALRSAPEWDTVRCLARAALALLQEDNQPN